MIVAVSAFVDELRSVQLFGELSQRQLRQLARLVKERRYRSGVTIVEQGTMSGVGFFIVAEGQALVSADGAELARLGPGDHFGELALITKEARTASVTSVTELRCLVIAFWDFRSFARKNPEVTWKLLQHVAALLVAERDRNALASLTSESLALA